MVAGLASCIVAAPSCPPGWPPDPALPVEGFADVDLSADRMWATFADVRRWHRWNPCIWRARIQGGELEVGAQLRWVFNPIRTWYPYKLPAVARIVEVEPGRKVTWEVRAGGLHALHSYLIEPVDDGHCRFGSWEIAQGPGFRWLRPFWLAHFRYVCRASLDGARALGDALKPGVRLRSYGEPSDEPPLVVVPGLDGSPASVAPIIERLSRSRQVLLADYTVERNVTLDALAVEIAALVALEIGGPVDLLGQSIGTLVVARLAGSEKLDVRKVALIATFTEARNSALRVANAVNRLSPRLLYRLTAAPLMAFVCGPVGDGWRHPFLRAVGRSNPPDARRRTAWQIDRDFTGDLVAISQPVRVLMGGRDRFVPDAQVAVAKLRSIFGDDAVVAIPRAGHVLLPTPAIERAVAEIEAFLG